MLSFIVKEELIKAPAAVSESDTSSGALKNRKLLPGVICLRRQFSRYNTRLNKPVNTQLIFYVLT